MKIIKYITLFLILLSTSMTLAQVRFEAKVSKKKLGINERLRIDFEMNEDGDNFNPPSFQNFTVVGGPNQSVSHAWANGKKTFSKTYSYFLSPKKRGKFTINQATILIKGNIYKSTPITIEVTKAIDKPRDPNDPDILVADNIHLVADVSNVNPYLNEAITVVYKLYVSPNTGVSNWREIDSPRYNDFWSQNIDIKGLKILNGTYKGEDYRYVVLRKTVLYPQKSGKLEIEPLSLDITVDVPTKRRNIFGERLMTQAHKTISAGSRTINVKALPENGRPANFTGAVGDFDFRVTTSKRELDASESLRASVSVSGNGNLKLFELPKLSVPSSLEVYEPENSDEIKTTINGMYGSRSENYTIVPQFKGKYPIPSISFSYFDLKTKSYKSITSKELVIDVLNGPTNNSTSNDNLSTNGSDKRHVILNNNQFAFIKTKANLVSTKKKNFFKTNAYWTALLVPLLAIPLAIVFRRRRDERLADVSGNKVRKADRLAKKYLGDAKRALGQKDAFYVALEKALHNYLKAKIQIETSEFSKDKISNILIERQVDEQTVLEFIGILKNCELARYTPITQVEMQQDYNKSSRTISEIDKQIR